METKKGNYYECVVRYDKVLENGLIKKVTETYCVDAVNFAEAEMRIFEEVASAGEFEIKNITPASYSSLFVGDNGKSYYKAKLQFVILDEITGKEKKKPVSYLVFAEDFPSALRTIQWVMESSAMDYTTAQISESKILDFYGRNNN